MSFIRPEVRQSLWRWREAIVGAAVTLFGVWMAIGGRGLLVIIGAATMVLGIGLLVAGWQRARFRIGPGGAGVVRVTEGQVTYYGPYTGGAMAVASITEVVLNPMPRSGPVWELRAPGVDPIRIPANAEGSEALFDVFGSLPGLQTEAMLAALNAPGKIPQVIWMRRGVSTDLPGSLPRSLPRSPH